MSLKINRLFGLLLAAALLLGACAPAAVPAPTEIPAAAEPTQAPVEPTVAPTAEPTQAPAPAEPIKLLLATTTSTADSGLLDFILPDFEKEFNAKVEVVAVGSGQAIQLGKDGNADVLLVHSPKAEGEFMDAGDGVRREDVMYNDFVIVGPADDPAKIKGLSAVDAFKALAAAKAAFISRGDDSGTHTKEKGIWAKAEIEPKGDWYISAGQGMGAVLTMTNEKKAYTLSDRATYLAQTKEGLELVVLVEGDKALLNPYGVIAVNPAKSEKINNDLANKFIDWIISVPMQEKIATFGQKDFNQSLFFPSSKPYKDANAPAPAAGGLKVTGKVGTEKAWTEEEVKALETMESQLPNKEGVIETYTGVSLKALLDMVVPSADASTLVFVADDGYTAEVPLADVMKCEKCIVAFRENGGFGSVMPDFAKNTNVKGLVEIQVK